MSNTSLSKYLTEELNRRSWSRRRFARQAGLGTTTVAQAVRGDSIPEPETIRKMADALGMDQRTLLRMAGHLDTKPVRQLDPRALDLVYRLSELPLDRRIKAFDAVGSIVEALHPGYIYAE